MNVSPREIVLAVITVGVILVGSTYFAGRPQVDKWRELRELQADAREAIALDERLIAGSSNWEAELEKLREVLPVFPHDQEMGIHWMSRMDAMAAKRGVTISRRQAGEEDALGDVYEVPIEAKEWEGDLDSMVRFLFDLQSAGGMLDVRQLLVKPKGKGVLRGRFTLYCAYIKNAPGTADE